MRREKVLTRKKMPRTCAKLFQRSEPHISGLKVNISYPSRDSVVKGSSSRGRVKSLLLRRFRRKKKQLFLFTDHRESHSKTLGLTMLSEHDDELLYRLSRFFEKEVFVPRRVLDRSKDMTFPCICALRDSLHEEESLAEMKLVPGGILFSGSKLEKALHVDAGETRVIFPFILNAVSWGCREVSPDEPENKSYSPYEIFLKEGLAHRQRDLDIFKLYGNDSGERKLLDPVKVKRAFRDRIEKIMCKIFPRSSWNNNWNILADSDDSPAVIIQFIKRHESELKFYVHAVVALQLRSQRCQDNPLLLPNALSGDWCRSYCDLEVDVVTTMDRDDGGCRVKLMRILKTLAFGKCQQISPLSFLDSYTLKNAILNLHDQGDWREENLAWCFRNVLMYIESCCWQREMPRFFEHERNLMSNFQEDVLDKVEHYLQEVREEDDYLRFFKE